MNAWQSHEGHSVLLCVQGKFYPFRDSFRRFHLMTVPLSPARAALLLGGAAKHMGYDTYQVRGADALKLKTLNLGIPGFSRIVWSAHVWQVDVGFGKPWGGMDPIWTGRGTRP